MKLLQEVLLLLALFMNVGIVLTSQAKELEGLGIRLQIARDTLNHYEGRCEQVRKALCERQEVYSGKMDCFDMLNVEYRSLQKIVRDKQKIVNSLEERMASESELLARENR